MANHFTHTPPAEGEHPLPKRSWTDVLVCIVAIALVFGAIVQWVVKGLGIEPPVWLDGETGNHLAGGQVMPELPKSLSEAFDEFESGQLQDDIDMHLTEHIPARALALLGNAGLQRSAIQASNALFHFPAYPTFYGSSYYYFSRYDSVLPAPLANVSSGWQDFANQLASFAARHEDIDFVVFAGTEGSDRDVNPLYDYVQGAESIEDFGAILEDTLGYSPNVHALMTDFASPDAYYELYNKSDNHWTILGAQAAYNAIAEEMGLDALEVDGVKEFDPSFYGSWSRASLGTVTDTPTDLDEDFSNLTITTTQNTYNAQDHSNYENASELYKTINFIQEYYDLFGIYSDDGIVTIDSSSMAEEDKRPAIVICDSYGYQSGRLLARGFGHVDIRYWLYAADQGDQRLEDLLAETGDKTVVFVGAAQYYSSFCWRHPHFFE